MSAKKIATKTQAARRKEAEDRVAELAAKTEALALERVATLLESPQPVEVPWREYPHFDDFSRYPASLSSYYVWSDVDDRTEGRYRPVYETPQDLAMIRATARRLKAFFPVAEGAEASLTNYVISTGYEYTVQPRPGKAADEALIRMLQSQIDEILEHNNFVGCLDREIHAASRVDGEVFSTVYPDSNSRVRIELTPPEFILEPMNARDLERMCGTHGKLNHWWHGVHTLHNPTLGRDDVQRPLGYHAVFDRIGANWDYLPASRVEHLKRNVDRMGRRGFSDYKIIMDDLENEGKIRRNTAIGTAILAAIVLLRQHADGTPKSSVESMVSASATSTYQKPVEGGTRTTNVQHTSPGTIKDAPAGQQWLLGPLGTLRSPVYIDVAQYLLRIMGTRWNMPEYLISGDASNANFASTQQAGTPFVRAREADQEVYATHFKNLLWKALHLKYQMGCLGHGTWKYICQCVDIKVEYQSPENRDPAERAQTDATLVDKGVMSKRTMATNHGLDYDEELKSIQAEPKQPARDPLTGWPAGGGFSSFPPPNGFNPRASYEARTQSLAVRAIDKLMEGEGKWVTINGTPVKIEDGESVGGAISRKFGDGAVVNVPLDKRGGGSLDSQIDKAVRDVKSAKKARDKAVSTRFRAGKAVAKSLLAKHGDELAAKFAAKHSMKPEQVKSHLTGWSKWEPEKLIKLMGEYGYSEE